MMGWKEIMKIPGTTKVQLLLLTILMISSVSSTGLLIYNLVSNTSEENISPKNVSLEVVRDGSDWKRYYGSSNELSADRKLLGNSAFKREILSLHSRLGDVNYEETKQLFLNNVLVEALDDGTPAYYNSNILGRYMRKDYGDFRTDT